ncbi:MAG: LysR family transcriptional regulator, partial [Pseudomonadota bacterium]
MTQYDADETTLAPRAMDWDTYRVFLAVARSPSITAAAAALDSSQPTVSRRIRDLEAQIGARLLDRTVAGVKLTPAGEEVLTRVRRIEQEAQALDTRCGGQDDLLEGKITLTAPEGLGQSVLPRLIASFAQAHPQIDITLSLDATKINLLNREADLAIRMGDPGQSTLIGTRVGEVPFGLYAAHGYIANHGAPRYKRGLEKHSYICGAQRLSSSPQARALKTLVPDGRRVFRSDSLIAQRDAARAGLGIVALPTYVAQDDPLLTEVLPGALTTTCEMWVLYHRDLRTVARIRAASEHFATGLRN